MIALRTAVAAESMTALLWTEEHPTPPALHVLVPPGIRTARLMADVIVDDEDLARRARDADIAVISWSFSKHRRSISSCSSMPMVLA
jgi:hypothetical protein